MVDSQAVGFHIFSFCTQDTPYEAEMLKLQYGCEKHDIPFVGIQVPDLKDWRRNCLQKATVLLAHFKAVAEPFLYLDADARVLKPLSLLESMGGLAIHRLGGRWENDEIYLTGTIWFRPESIIAGAVLTDWDQRCRKDQEPKKADQEYFFDAVQPHKSHITFLPQSYAKIYWMPDYDETGNDPAILHTQASRRLKEKINKK